MNSNKNCSKVMSLMTFSRFDADQAQHNADHATPFFIESNCLPLRSLFFQQLSYLMYDVHDKTDPKSLLDKFAKTNTKHHYKTQLSAKECFSVKFSRTEKMKKSLLELVCLFGILFHCLLRLSTYLIFVKKLNYLTVNE